MKFNEAKKGDTRITECVYVCVYIYIIIIYKNGIVRFNALSNLATLCSSRVESFRERNMTGNNDRVPSSVITSV